MFDMLVQFEEYDTMDKIKKNLSALKENHVEIKINVFLRCDLFYFGRYALIVWRCQLLTHPVLTGSSITLVHTKQYGTRHQKTVTLLLREVTSHLVFKLMCSCFLTWPAK
jgi:hypothetical protein